MERESQFNEIPIDEDISIHRADDEIDLHIPFRIRVAPDVKLASDAEVLFRGGNAWDLRELKRLHHLKQERQRLPISPLDLPEQ